ncbi:MAG: fas [Actinomycetia bacterium]|nr:fas [Actinomycetes bacterium]
MAGIMRERFVAVASELLDRDDRLAVVTADLTAEQFTQARHRHPERVLNLGIREQLLIGVGGGLALAGMRPVVHSFSSFLIERPFEQIKLDLNHQGVGAILVSAGASYDIAAAGRTHQSPGDVALLSTLPDWTIHVPGHPDEAEAQLREAVQGDGLVYIRLSNQANKEPYGLGGSPSPGELHPLRQGGSATVVVVGPLADTVLDAVDGLDVTVLYAATIRPFDADGLRAAIAGQREAAVILVEPYLAGTSTALVSACLSRIPHRILALGVPHEELRRYGSSAQHARSHGLDRNGIRQSITEFLATDHGTVTG